MTSKVKKYTAGRGLAIFLVITGSTHFISPEGFDAIVPPILPFDPRLWTYLSGFAELLVAALLLVPISKKFLNVHVRLIAGWLALALFVAVFPANIYMAIDYSDREIMDRVISISRLPLQFGLFYWCWALNKDMNKELAKAS
jgi:hypothetical protein